MSAQAFRYLYHNEGQKITHDTVLSKIGDLEWENLKSLALMLNGTAQTVCFYGLDLAVDTSDSTKMTLSSGALAQSASEGDFDDLSLEDDSLFKVAILAEDLSISLPDGIADGSHIIQAYIDRTLDSDTKENVQVFSSDNSTNQFLTQEKEVEKKINLVVEIKQGGDTLPSVTDGYVKLAEITVESSALTNVLDIYSQDEWSDQDTSVVTGQSFSGLRTLIESSTSELSNDITELEESIKSLLSDAASISITEDTTINSVHRVKASSPDGSGLVNNPFDIDLTASGVAFYEKEMVLTEDIWLDEYGYYKTEDERLRFKGSWVKDSETEFYITESVGSKVIFTFLGTNVLPLLKSNSAESIEAKIDSRSSVTIDDKTFSEGGFWRVYEKDFDYGIHTLTLTALDSFEIKGFLVLGDITSSDEDQIIQLNTGEYNILNNLIVPETTEMTLPSYTTGYGRRDVILVDQDEQDFERSAGTSLAASNELYGANVQNHTNEELAYEMEALKYQKYCSNQDFWSGIYAASLEEDTTNLCLFGSALKAGERFEFRFEGTGLDIEINTTSTTKFQIKINGEEIASDSGGEIEVSSGRQYVRLCSNLMYSDYVLELEIIEDEEDSGSEYGIYLYNALVYRPKTPTNSSSSKLAVAGINLVSEDALEYQFIHKIASYGDSDNTDWEIEEDSYCWGGKKCSNSDNNSQDLIFYVFGKNVNIYGNKGPSKGSFKVTGISSTIDCSVDDEGNTLTEDLYNELLASISFNDYGLHQITVNVEGDESQAVELIAISTDRRAFLDNQSNLLYKKTEVLKSEGFKERFDALYRSLKLDSQKREIQIAEIEGNVSEEIKNQAFINALIFG